MKRVTAMKYYKHSCRSCEGEVKLDSYQMKMAEGKGDKLHCPYCLFELDSQSVVYCVYSPMTAKRFLKAVKNNFYYGFKTLCSVLSGFSGVEAKNPYNDYAFEPVDEWSDDDPYYVCAAFNNGRHIPLPIVMNGESEYILQDIVILCFWHHPALKQARIECQKYIDHYYDLPPVVIE